jgi:hypothetical protein
LEIFLGSIGTELFGLVAKKKASDPDAMYMYRIAGSLIPSLERGEEGGTHNPRRRSNIYLTKGISRIYL